MLVRNYAGMELCWHGSIPSGDGRRPALDGTAGKSGVTVPLAGRSWLLCRGDDRVRGTCTPGALKAVLLNRHEIWMSWMRWSTPMAAQSLFSSPQPAVESRTLPRVGGAGLPLFQEPVYPPGTPRPDGGASYGDGPHDGGPDGDEPDSQRSPVFTTSATAAPYARAAGKGRGGRPTASRTGRSGQADRIGRS